MPSSNVATVEPEQKFKNKKQKQLLRNHRLIQIIVDLTIIISVAIVYLIIVLKVDPRVNFFYCNDHDIFYPNIQEIVPFWAVPIYGIIGPLLIITFVEFFNIKYQKIQKLKEKRTNTQTFFIHFFHAVSLFFMGMVITLVLTEIGKRWIGRLRPNFISICKPEFSKLNCTTNAASGFIYNAIYTGGAFCKGDLNEVKEARLSFPSGHSSFAWYTMVFTIIYLEARFSLLCFRYVKTTTQLVCFIAAFVTTLSRVSDYRHRGSDVIGGSLLGVLVAFFITFATGRVLFEYNRIRLVTDLDMRTENYNDKKELKFELKKF